MIKDIQWNTIEKILEEVQVGLTFVGTDGNIFYFNRLAKQLLGWGKKLENSVLKCHKQSIHVGVLKKIKNNSGMEWHRVIKLNERFIENTYSPFKMPQFTGIVIITRDVTEREKMSEAIRKAAEDLQENNFLLLKEIRERKMAEEALRESEVRFRTLVNSMDDIVYTLNTDQHHTGVYGRWVEKRGLTPEYFIGKTPFDIFGEEAQVHEDANKRAIAGENVLYEWSADYPEGRRHYQTSLSPIRDSEKNVVGIVGVGRDITDGKKAEEMIQRLSYLDGLTGIANRRYFDEQLDREWQRSSRNLRPLSLIMCDIDYFKLYNDTYGHQSGDECLKQVAAALSGIINRPADFTARYGGEEFVIVLPETQEEGAAAVAEGIRAGIEGLHIIHEKSMVSDYVTVSLGVATVIPEANLSPADLISRADLALYRAKGKGRNRVSVFQGDAENI